MAQISQLRDIYADDHADADKEKQKWDAFAAAEAICSIVEACASIRLEAELCTFCG